MCCLRYEFEAYRDFKGRAPKKNAIIETPLGKAKIIEYDTPKEQIALRLESGKMIRVPLAGMTCSEAAHKKSEDLGCPCRPDTVTRDVLESLQSADVDMALADLDRANGIAPKETFDESDIFVENKKSRRRGKSSRPSESDGGPRPEGSAPQEGARRRRRTKQAGEGQSQQQAPSGEHAGRRRHHHASGDAATQGDSTRQDQPKTQGQKRTRRPGDRGGATHPVASDAASSPKQSEGATDAPKRKRRHRGGRGHGKGNGGGTDSSSAQGASSQGAE